MTAKRFLIWILAVALLITLCACETKENTSDPTTVTSTEKSMPDYGSMIEEKLGVKPEPSTFDELIVLSQAMRGPGYYREDEEHHCCTLVYNGNLYYVIRYEKAQEWFKYRFTVNDHMSFEEDNGRLFIRDESYTGPEGMLIPYNFVAFVDNSCKFPFIVQGYEEIPKVSDDDINAFKSFFDDGVL